VVRVGNHTARVWARAVLDIEVPRGTDVAHVSELLRQLAVSMHEEDEWADAILESPRCGAVEAITADALVLRLAVKTHPAQQGRSRVRAARPDHPAVRPARGIRIPQRARSGSAPPTTPHPSPHDHEGILVLGHQQAS